MKLPTLDIVIVNWNTGDALRQCLDSITHTRFDQLLLLRICIVDNASSDASLDEICDTGMPLVVYRNSSNKGFAAACNQGAGGSRADYLLFLNPDTKLTPTSLPACIHFMEEPDSESVGICGIPLLDDSGEPGICCAAFPSARSLCLESCGLQGLIGRPRFISYRKSVSGSKSRLTVDQVIGAFFLIRASVFVHLGGFDERFFMYYEEVDLSLRALASGYTSCVLLETFAYHTGCVSSIGVKDRRLFYSVRSKLQYARKHFSPGGQLLVGIVTLFLEPAVRCLHGVGTNALDGVTTTVRGYGYLLPALLTRLRRQVSNWLAE